MREQVLGEEIKEKADGWRNTEKKKIVFQIIQRDYTSDALAL